VTMGPDQMPCALAVTALLVVFCCVGADSAIIAGYRAYDISDDTQKRVLPILNRLARIAGVPVPRLLLTIHPQPNALALGNFRNKSTIILSVALLDILSDDELAGALAHELAHIRRNDVLLLRVTTVLVAILLSICCILIVLGRTFTRQGGPTLIFTAIMLALIATKIQAALSYDRELAADLAGAKICGRPEWLIGALKKLEHEQLPVEPMTHFTSHLLFVGRVSNNPTNTVGRNLPGIRARIRALRITHKSAT
jgi:heat shock protein HtpX